MWIEVLPGDGLKDKAGRLLLNHPLRAADALQLAAALTWAEKSAKDHELVCFDLRLRDAARKEGFTLLPEIIH